MSRFSDDMTQSRSIWFDSDRKMSLGLMMPIGENSHFGGDARYSDIVHMAQTARDVGFDALWFADHYQFRNDVSGEIHGNWECWTTMAAIADRVDDVQIGSLVACAGFINPGIVAKMANTIDEISGGRFILGLGAGWNRFEYEQFGLPFDFRVSRFEDAVRIIRELLRDGASDHKGKFYQTSGAVISPRGPRKSGAPILVGSTGDRMIELIVEYADAWNTAWHSDPEGVKALMRKIDAACQKAGREPSSLIRTAGGNFAMEGYSSRRPDPISGSPDDMAVKLGEFRNLGLSHFVCGLDVCTPDTIRAFGEVIQRFDHTGTDNL